MKKIINPWKGMEGYNCFGCAPNNEAGVKMEFYEDNDEVISIWRPRPEYQGWIDTLHGGIQAVLLDEICAWVILRKLQTTGVTSKMDRLTHSKSTTMMRFAAGRPHSKSSTPPSTKPIAPPESHALTPLA